MPDPTDGAIAVLSAIRDFGSWDSGDRPDLYSDAHRLAIEVMRVDDHPKVGKLALHERGCRWGLKPPASRSERAM